MRTQKFYTLIGFNKKNNHTHIFMYVGRVCLIKSTTETIELFKLLNVMKTATKYFKRKSGKKYIKMLSRFT